MMFTINDLMVGDGMEKNADLLSYCVPAFSAVIECNL